MSISSEVTRIGNALNAIESGKRSIADALTAKGVDTMPDASFDTLSTNVGLIQSGGGSGSESFSVDVPAAGVYNAANKIKMGTISNFDPDATYVADIVYTGDYSQATTSEPVVIRAFLIASANAALVADYRQFVLAYRATSATATSSNVMNIKTSTYMDTVGNLYLYSYSTTAYTRLGAGRYTATVVKI